MAGLLGGLKRKQAHTAADLASVWLVWAFALCVCHVAYLFIDIVRQ